MVAVAVIGSFRQHMEQVREAVRTFDAAGWAVTTPRDTPLLNDGDLFVRFESDDAGDSDALVQAKTLHRILRADLVYAVAPGGYVGRTTCYEIGRILQAGRPLYISSRPVDLPLALPVGRVISPSALVDQVARVGPTAVWAGATEDVAALEHRLQALDLDPDV